MEWILLFLQTLLFLTLSLFIFTLPGYFILNVQLQNSQPWKNFSLSSIAGFVAFTLLSYLLFLLHLSIVLPIIILAVDLFYLKNETLPIFSQFLKIPNFLILVIFFVGIVGQLLVIAPSGINLNGNLVFWSAHGHDGVWHLALVNQLQNAFPLQNPDFTGEKLTNYHFFSDISIAQLNYFFKLSSLDLYFRFFPLLFSVLLAILSFQLGKLLGKTNSAGVWAFIFTFFAGSFGYIVTFLQSRVIEGENLFWTYQVQSVSGNPPQSIAFIIVLGVLILVNDYLSTASKRIGLGIVLLTGALSEFKVYGAVILLFSLLLTSIWYFLKTKNESLLLIFLASALSSAFLYLPNTSNSENLLLFEPWWFIRTMVVASDKLNWIDLELKRQTYLAHHSYLRVAQIELEAFFIFLIGNLGMRVLGIWYFVSRKLFDSYLNFQIIAMLIISLIIPMLFIQKGIPANTIQFFQYFLLLFGIIAGVSTSQILSRLSSRWLQIFIAILIVILAVPTQIGLLMVFYRRPAFAQISSTELKALNYLQKNSQVDDVILNPPFAKNDFKQSTPPIWLWSDTSYVSAFSSKRVYLADIEQLDIMGYKYQTRQIVQKEVFSTSNPVQFKNLLKQNSIKYLYFPKTQRPKIDIAKTDLQNVYQNDEMEIWKVN